jgi:hypothetical protein
MVIGRRVGQRGMAALGLEGYTAGEIANAFDVNEGQVYPVLRLSEPQTRALWWTPDFRCGRTGPARDYFCVSPAAAVGSDTAGHRIVEYFLRVAVMIKLLSRKKLPFP